MICFFKHPIRHGKVGVMIFVLIYVRECIVCSAAIGNITTCYTHTPIHEIFILYNVMFLILQHSGLLDGSQENETSNYGQGENTEGSSLFYIYTSTNGSLEKYI